MRRYPIADWKILERPRVLPMPRRKRNLAHRAILFLSRREIKAKNDLTVIESLLHMGILCPLYLLWMQQLLFKGRVERADKERVVLRTAWRTGCIYEWTHHVHLAKKAGVSDAEIWDIAKEDVSAFPPRQRCMLRMVDELLASRTLSSATFSELRGYLPEDQCLELIMLCGHYQMISLVINSSGVQVEPEFALGTVPTALQTTARVRAGEAGVAQGVFS